MQKTFILVFVLLFSASAYAAPEKYIYDPLHTQIRFSVDHMGFSHPQGKFDRLSGGFIFDQEKPELSSADITIDTGSINMGSAAWDTHMKSADFFDAAQFPAMKFKTTKVEKTGGNNGKITGDITIRGITKPVTLEVTFNKAGIFPMNKNYLAGFSLTGMLKRSDFGMAYGLPGLGDEVALNIQVEGIRQDFEKIAK
jgi:polyisoprenoid-binding protein YceI